MSSAVVRCPSCQNETRIPETLYGHPVKCPVCKGFFQAPTRNPDGSFTEPIKLDVSTKTKSNSPFLAGLVLLLAGFTGLVADVAFILFSQTNKEGIIEEMIKQVMNPNGQLRRWFEAPEKMDPIELRQQIEENLDTLRNAHIPFAGISLFVCLGAIGIFLHRGYWFCILACIASMTNLGAGCCLMGLPAGIYAIVKLIDPEVRQLFRRS
jgi:hypothetical protein